jgi:hypothetical protein
MFVPAITRFLNRLQWRCKMAKKDVKLKHHAHITDAARYLISMLRKSEKDSVIYPMLK